MMAAREFRAFCDPLAGKSIRSRGLPYAVQAVADLLVSSCLQKRQPSIAKKPAERVVKDIRRATRRHFSAEDKIRIVLEGLRGDDSIAELCRKEGIAQSLYYTWSKEFLEAGKRRLAGDTVRAATTDEVKDLRREASALKECVADLTLENRLLKKSMIADGGDDT
jgi:transposase